MPIKLKSIQDIATKWSKRAAAAAPEYQAGIQSPKADWATETKNSEGAYQAGVQDSIARGAFGKGVQSAGTEKWSRKSLAVGPARYGTGVNAAQSDYATQFQPYADALQRVTLPPRGRRGDPSNVERVRQIATALHSQKTGSA